jgi:hypothetical protein
LPKRISLGYRTFTVRKDRHLPSGELGQCQNDKGLILIAPGQLGDDEANTVLHELLHAALHLGHVSLEDDKEEQVVTVLGNAITELWKRNPSLISYLQERLCSDRT